MTCILVYILRERGGGGLRGKDSPSNDTTQCFELLNRNNRNELRAD